MSRCVALTTLTAAPTAQPILDIEPTLTQGEQTYIDNVKELEARFSGKPSKKSHASQKTKTVKAKSKQAKQPMHRAFHLSNVMKGRKGVVIHKGTTLWSLVRQLPWTKTPMLNLLTTRVKLLDGHLNKRTTLLSLPRIIAHASLLKEDTRVESFAFTFLGNVPSMTWKLSLQRHGQLQLAMRFGRRVSFDPVFRSRS